MSETWAVVLAAGAGRRMGSQPKALLPFRSRTFLETIVATARSAGVDGVAVVVGHHAKAVAPLAERIADLVIENPNPDRGMGSSARKAARALPEGAAFLLWPVDIPAVRTETVAALLASGRAEPERVVVPTHEGRTGHPALLPARMLGAVRDMLATGRIDWLIEAEGSPVVELPSQDAGVLRDVDRPTDLEELEAGWRAK